MKRKRLSGLKVFLICILINLFIVALQKNNIEPYKPVPGPIDTRKYSKAAWNDGSIPLKKVPDIPSTIRVHVVGMPQHRGYMPNLYDIEMDFEEFMYQMGIDPEDIRDYIGD